MKMFLTRIGFGCKVVITADDTQVDLQGGRSGIEGLEAVLQGIEGMAWVHLGRRDVVRHRIVQDIVSAYETAEASRTGAPRTGRADRGSRALRAARPEAASRV
jgi:phosphate starvation-inducible PhoH-like protein